MRLTQFVLLMGTGAVLAAPVSKRADDRALGVPGSNVVSYTVPRDVCDSAAAGMLSRRDGEETEGPKEPTLEKPEPKEPKPEKPEPKKPEPKKPEPKEPKEPKSPAAPLPYPKPAPVPVPVPVPVPYPVPLPVPAPGYGPKGPGKGGPGKEGGDEEDALISQT